MSTEKNHRLFNRHLELDETMRDTSSRRNYKKRTAGINSQLKLKCEVSIRMREILTPFGFFFLHTAWTVDGLVHHCMASVDHV